MPPTRVVFLSLKFADGSFYTPDDLYRVSVCLGATVVDVRLRPDLTTGVWNEARLRALLGDAYDPLPAWGNRNTREAEQNASERLASMLFTTEDFEAGLPAFEAMRGVVIVFCPCSDSQICHQQRIKSWLRMRGYACEGLPRKTFAKPDAANPTLF